MKRYLGIVGRVVSALFLLLVVVILLEIAVGWRCNLKGQIPAPTAQPSDKSASTVGIKDYSRPQDDTFLSYPEWYIVWSYQEKADFQQRHLPSAFPYFAAVRQYWSSYCCIWRLIRGKYGFNAGEQLMLLVIGTSFSAEYVLKGGYEHTLGALSEWTSGGAPTAEDQFAAMVAREYAEFVHVRPFYEFHFARRIAPLWTSTGLFDRHLLRKWERKLFLTADYSIEGLYCWLIEKLTHSTYGSEPTETYAWIVDLTPQRSTPIEHVRLIRRMGPTASIVALPRYHEFTSTASGLAAKGIQFVEIAGNSAILLSALAPQSWSYQGTNLEELFSAPLLTDPSRKRVVMRSDVSALASVLNALSGSVANVEHIYDY